MRYTSVMVKHNIKSYFELAYCLSRGSFRNICCPDVLGQRLFTEMLGAKLYAREKVRIDKKSINEGLSLFFFLQLSNIVSIVCKNVKEIVV